MYSKIILSKFDDTYSTFYIIINVSNDTFKVHFTTIDYINSQYYDKISLIVTGFITREKVSEKSKPLNAKLRKSYTD